MSDELEKLRRENEQLKEGMRRMLEDCKQCREQYEQLIAGAQRASEVKNENL